MDNPKKSLKTEDEYNVGKDSFKTQIVTLTVRKLDQLLAIASAIEQKGEGSTSRELFG